MTCLIPLLASAQNPSLNYQIYKDPAGNTLRAHIWKVVGGEVFLETDQGRKLRLPINIFSADSQGRLQAFTAPTPPPKAAPAFTPAPPSPASNPLLPPTTLPLTTGTFGSPPAPSTNAPPPPTTAGLPPTTNSFPTPGASTPLPTGSPMPAIASTNPFGAAAATGGNIDATTIIQEGAAIIGHVDFEKISKSPFFQAIKSMTPVGAPGAPDDSDKMFGLSVEDIATVTFCIPSLEGIDSSSLESGGGNLPEDFKFAVAASFTKPINIEEAKAALKSDPKHPPVFSEFAGATLAIAPPGAENDMPPNFCMAIKNQGGGAVAIAGDRPSVEAALTNGQSKSATSNSSVFANLPAERDFWLTVEIPPSLAAEISKEASSSGKDDPGAAMIGGLIQQLQSIGLALSFSDKAKINVFTQCKDAAGATNVSNALNGLVTMAKMTQQSGAGAAGGSPEFLNTLAITSQDSLVSASIQVTGSDIGKLVGGLLMGGLGSGDGPPPGFGSSSSSAPPGFPSTGTPPSGFPSTGSDFGAPPSPASSANPFPPSGSSTAPSPSAGGNPFPSTATPPAPSAPPAPAAGGAVNPFAN